MYADIGYCIDCYTFSSIIEYDKNGRKYKLRKLETFYLFYTKALQRFHIFDFTPIIKIATGNKENSHVKKKKNVRVGCPKVCLKIAFRHLCVPPCGRFGPDEGGVAGYVDRIGTK